MGVKCGFPGMKCIKIAKIPVFKKIPRSASSGTRPKYEGSPDFVS